MTVGAEREHSQPICCHPPALRSLCGKRPRERSTRSLNVMTVRSPGSRDPFQLMAVFRFSCHRAMQCKCKLARGLRLSGRTKQGRPQTLTLPTMPLEWDSVLNCEEKCRIGALNAGPAWKTQYLCSPTQASSLWPPTLKFSGISKKASSPSPSSRAPMPVLVMMTVTMVTALALSVVSGA